MIEIYLIGLAMMSAAFGYATADKEKNPTILWSGFGTAILWPFFVPFVFFAGAAAFLRNRKNRR